MRHLAKLFKALGDETRLRIMALLTKGELCVCDIMGVLDLPQSTVSRHLAYLKNTGLVDDRRQGVWMFYRLSRGRGRFEGELVALIERLLPGVERVAEDMEALGRAQKAGCKEEG